MSLHQTLHHKLLMNAVNECLFLCQEPDSVKNRNVLFHCCSTTPINLVVTLTEKLYYLGILLMQPVVHNYFEYFAMLLYYRKTLQVDLTPKKCHLSCTLDSSWSRHWPTFCHAWYILSHSSVLQQNMNQVTNEIHFLPKSGVELWPYSYIIG